MFPDTLISNSTTGLDDPPGVRGGGDGGGRDGGGDNVGEGNPTVDEEILCEKVAIQHESIPIRLQSELVMNSIAV
jgi:hypothetical protein